MPARVSAWDSFSGVWPPYCTMQPSRVPRLLLAPDQGDHVFRGQRLEIQPVGGVVVGAETVSGLQLTMMVSNPASFSA